MVAIASFLFVGCLPTTPSEGEGEGEGEVEVAMTFDKEYTNASGVTYVSCDSDITVTFPTAVEVDYVVQIAVKIWDESAQEYTYPHIRWAEPNTDRTVWTVSSEDFNWKESESPCEPVCLVALVKHPCCPGEEVVLRIVTVDCAPPVLDLFVKFTDCDDPCTEPDPCVEEFAGVSMEWTSRTTDICETEDCCMDTCSGVNGWSLVIDPDICEGPCDTVTGTGCPVEGVLGCECLAYADTGEVCYYIDFYVDDNVGNYVESEWKICLDTDEVTSVEIEGMPVKATPDVWYTIYGYCAEL